MFVSSVVRRAHQRHAACAVSLLSFLVISCGSGDAPTAPVKGLSFQSAPCLSTGTIQVPVAQTVRVDCSNGGNTVTLAGSGANYLVVAQLAAYGVADQFVSYQLDSGATFAANRIPATLAGLRAVRSRALGPSLAAVGGTIPRPRRKQLTFTGALRRRALTNLKLGKWSRPSATMKRSPTISTAISRDVVATPAVGTVRQFRVLTDSTGSGFTTVSATLAYAGANLLLYVDTLSPTGGFTTAQLQAFGALFDQTFYPIDTAAFGTASDIDQNGHVIMLMSPAVNALTSKADCQTSGYVAGFFDEEDLSGGTSDPNSNHGEIFYSIAPDPGGAVSCAHTTADVGLDVPATFLHELQHLISYSQHVVVHGGLPEEGWLDEGLSIVAEEMGSLYYEQKCPGTACRTNPSQLFPDSSQGFVADFLYDSYQYALLPDTASLTLHSDADDGFSWRGGDWLMMRWLGDQYGSGLFKRLDQGSQVGVPNIEAATGQSFPSLFANFGLALYTDSLPGLPRTTAPAVNRFVTRNVKALWNRLFVTSGGSLDIPVANPVQLFAITADTSTAVMDPGTMSYFRMATPTTESAVTIRFAAPGGSSLAAAMHPQLAIFRLPPGQ